MSDAAARAEIDRILTDGGDADDVLRAIVATLVTSGGCAWAGILFREEDELVLGPEAGAPRPEDRLRVPVTFGTTTIAELVADGCPDEALPRHVAPLISEYCLVAWDTGGVPWDALS